MIDTSQGEPAAEGRRFRQLRTLTEVSRALTSTLSTDEIFRIVMPHAAELLGSDRAVLLFADEQGQYMVRAAHGVEDALVERCNRPTEASVEELLELVLAARQEEILAVPLVARDRVSGVLAVRLSRALADADGWALAALADQAAVALDQAGLATPRQNEELLGLLVDFLADHVIVALDGEGRVETWNHGAERALGYRAWEVLGRPLGQFRAEPDPEAARASLHAACISGRHEEEVPWVRKDGASFLASVLLVAFKEPDGRVRGFAVLARDITERRRVEQAQRDIIREQAARAEAEAQRDRYRLVGRATKDAIRDWNIESGAVEWSEALQSAHGHALAEVAPTLDWWTAHVHPDDRARVTEKLHAVLAGAGESWSDEYAFLRGDGSAARVYDRGYILRDDAGRPTRMISSMLDLSERVRMERALRDREERLRLAADAAEVGTWRIDLKTGSGPPATAREEQDPSLETPTLTEFLAQVHPDDRAQVQERLTTCLQRGGPYSSVHRVLKAEGNVRWIRDRGKVIRGADGEPEYITGAAADITELKEIDEQRQKLVVVAEEARAQSERERLRAETANRMKDEFLATVSHELRTPLTAILGWARILRDTQFDRARVEKGIEIIERNARAQVRIVEDILDVSRIITGKVQLDLRRLSVAGMLDAAMNTVSSAAIAKGVTMHVTTTTPLGELLGDSERLQQVLWNLLANAIKFTPQGGEIELSATRSEGHVEISVRDTGKGITAAFLPHVFERFLQDDATTTRSFGGLGLGLAIVRHIVELHGGTVEAHSPGEGQGATFIVRLPVGAAASQAAPEPVWAVHEVHDSRALAGTELLVIDDEQDTRELVATILESAGAHVVMATSAAEAMEVLQSRSPDAIVSDIGMPGEDGYSLIQRIRTSSDDKIRFVPALALTAYARAEDRRRARAAGFQMYLSKPIQPEELIQMVVELLEGRMLGS